MKEEAMSDRAFVTSVTSTTMYVSIPEGRRIRGRVKEVEGTFAEPGQVHPGKRHPWREMLHCGQPGTGFAQCICGAVGIPFRRVESQP